MSLKTTQSVEKWLGDVEADRLSTAMKDWYGPPIAVANVPGRVYIAKGGEYVGQYHKGFYSNLLDRVHDRAALVRKKFMNWSRNQRLQLNAGFSSLSDLISEATSGGKRREFPFLKSGSTGVVGATSSLWRQGSLPAAGAAPANAPGGTAYTDVNSFVFTNPDSGDTQHFVTGYPLSSVAGNTLLLYDLIFGVNKTMNSTANEAVSGAPSRYQSTTTTDPDYIGGNFLFIQVGGTQLAATAHNWVQGGTVNGGCVYSNDTNGTGNLPTLTGNSAGIVDRLDHPVGQWFAPLAAGDKGVRAITKMECSAAVATGVIWFMIGHPIAFMPCPAANLVCVTDGINSAFNLARIFDDACLAFLEICKPATTATTYTGSFTTVAG